MKFHSIYHKLILSGIFLLAGTMAVFALEKDSIVPSIPTRIRIYTESEWQDASSVVRRPDTSLSSFHRTDPVTKNNDQNLGCLGSPAKALEFSMQPSMFRGMGLTLFDHYMLQSSKIDYYRTNKRYTAVDFQSGEFREQGIGVLHTQNILKNWNAGIDFRRYNVQDYLPRSDTYYNKFVFFTDYASTNGRYRLFAHSFWNTMRNQVNGGLVNDSDYTENSLSSLSMKGLAVQLSNATIRNKVKNYHVSNYYNFLRADSVTFKLRAGFYSTLSVGTFAYRDEGEDSTYYKDFYLGADSYDSLRYTDWRNKASIELLPGKGPVKVHLIGWIEHQQYSYYNLTTSEWANLAPGGSARVRAGKLDLQMGFSFVVSGEDKGTYSVNAGAAWNAEIISIQLSGSARSDAVPILFRRFEGNHFRWSTDFDKQNTTDLRFSVSFPKHGGSAFVRLQTMNDFVYMDEMIKPAKADDRITVTTFGIQKDFRWKNWHLDNTVIFQESGTQQYLQLPDWSLRHSFYWERAIFKNKLVIHPGIDFRYLSSWKGDAFMPATGLFYRQNEIVTGNAALVDLFLTFKIKSATFYVKLENLTDDVLNDYYFLTPGYPQPGLVSKFGIRWCFYDQ